MGNFLPFPLFGRARISLMTSSKEEVYHKICHAVLHLEIAKGNLKWSLSDISREADVTRSLIYYYFGKEKETILEEAFKYVSEVMFNTDQSQRLGIVNRMKFVLERVREMPYIFVLFFLRKRDGGELSDIIQKAEDHLLFILDRDFPELSKDEVRKLYLLELGAIATNMSDEETEKVFQEFVSKQK